MIDAEGLLLSMIILVMLPALISICIAVSVAAKYKNDYDLEILWYEKNLVALFATAYMPSMIIYLVGWGVGVWQ